MTADMQDKASVTVKPLDLSNLLKHAFMSGQGSMTTHSQWVDYDPSECPAYERIAAALAQAYQPIGYITPDALKHLRMGIDCQPIHKDDRHGFTVPVYATPPTALSVEKAPAVENPAPVPHSSVWQDMATAPLNGRHCILAVQEDCFIYAVQGAYDGKQWNAVHREAVEPLCWMPNVRLPAEFLPAGFVGSLATTEGSDNG